MYNETILEREDGTKIKIRVGFYIHNPDKPIYDIDLYICLPRKRKFSRLEFDSHSYRSLSLAERKEFELKEYLKFVTKEELHAAKVELWQLLIPEKVDPDKT